MKFYVYRIFGGLLGILGAYIAAHGEKAIETAVVPHLRRLLRAA
jgi:hypothetical protein